MTNSMQIAETILAQLGGNRFRVMTGAKHFIGGENYLTFKLPANFAAKGINCVRIDLTPADLYRVQFLKVRGVKVATVAEHDGIYCDMLCDLFTEETGLLVSM